METFHEHAYIFCVKYISRVKKKLDMTTVRNFGVTAAKCNS